MEQVLSFLERLMAFLTSMDERQMGLLRSMDERQMSFLRSMKEEQTTFHTYMKNLQTSMYERQAKLNASNLQNKLEDEDNMKKEQEEQKVTKKEEVMCDSYQVKQLQESPAPWLSSCSSRTEEKKYRLHILMDEGHENGRLKIIEGEPISNIHVILMYGDELVPASDHLASLRVELVVIRGNYYIEGSTDWPRKEFEDNLMLVPNSSTRMTVERGRFNLVGGRKVHSVASIKQSSGKKKVRLGVMVVDDGVQERVLEGVSSNEFSVIHKPRRPGATCAEKESKRETGNSELNTNGKRAIKNRYDDTLQPSTSSYLQFSGHVQSAQKFAQHATSEQPSHARNACLTQNRPTTPIDAGNIGRAVPPAYAANSYQGLPALVHKKLDENHGNFSEEAYYGNQGHVDLSSQNLMTVPGKRVHIGTTRQPSASYSQFEGHVQSPQKFGHHATGKQPSHARNAYWPQNCTATIGNIGGAVPPQAYYAPNANAASVQTYSTQKLDDNQGISFQEGFNNNWLMTDKPDDNQDHVDPSLQNLMMGINPVQENLQGLQTQLGNMVQQGNNSAGGTQGQPSTPWSNNLHTNSLGHITTAATTNDFTSAQMGINSTKDDLDVEMGGHEQVMADVSGMMIMVVAMMVDMWEMKKMVSLIGSHFNFQTLLGQSQC